MRFAVMRNLVLALFLALSPVAVMGPQPTLAQETVDKIDYDAWDNVAKRAESSIAAGRASNEAFESLRSEVVIWRERFLRGQDVNTQRIRTLRGQIEALGPAPEEGVSEPSEIAERRSALAEQLANALAPITKAEEAFSRADGLAREIDGIIRERQADALLKLAPSPLNPSLWPDAISDLLGSFRLMGSEFADSWRSDAKREAFRDNLPKTILYLLIAVLLIFRGRVVMQRMTALVMERTRGRARQLAGFITSLGQILVPVLGIFMLVEALQSTSMKMPSTGTRI